MASAVALATRCCSEGRSLGRLLRDHRCLASHEIAAPRAICFEIGPLGIVQLFVLGAWVRLRQGCHVSTPSHFGGRARAPWTCCLAFTIGLLSSLTFAEAQGTAGSPRVGLQLMRTWDGLSYSSFGGVFEEGYTRMDVVTDLAEQVVSIQLVGEGARVPAHFWTEAGWHTYNFVNSRTKSRPSLRVYHRVTPHEHAVQVDSHVWDGKAGKNLEVSRWYVPKPLINLILHVVN